MGKIEDWKNQLCVIGLYSFNQTHIYFFNQTNYYEQGYTQYFVPK